MRDIRKYFKPEKILVVELDDGVEYMIPQEGVADLESGKDLVRATRVVDRAERLLSARRIMWALESGGPVDYIDPPGTR